MTIVLSTEDLVALTKKEKPTYQAKQLVHLGIPYKARTDGSLVVLRAHVEGLLGAVSDRKPEPQLRFNS